MRVFLLALLVCVCWTEVRAAPAPNGGCQRPEVLLKAGRAVDQINLERTEGYIIGLNRVYDVTYQDGFISQLIIDVMETTCHVLSLKQWRQCEAKDTGSVPVEGQCALTFNGASLTHSCSLRPVSPRAIVQYCPDCPTAGSLNDPEARRTVNTLLEKHNRENDQSMFLSLLSITQFSMQFFGGPSYFVHFTVKDTRSAKKGFCQGGRLIDISRQEFQIISCEIFRPETSPRPRPSGSVVVLPPLDNVPPRPPPSSTQCPSARTYCVVNCFNRI